MKQFDATILAHASVAEDWKELSFSWEAQPPSAGQFLSLRPSPYADPLLRRPFAFSAFHPADAQGPARASIIYQVRGNSTRLIAELGTGSSLDVLGPLGNGFPADDSPTLAVIIGGGIGLGPSLFLASRFAEAGKPSLFILGLRSANRLPRLALPQASILCTDDGSSGFQGTPIGWLRQNTDKGHLLDAAAPVLPRSGTTKIHLFACGPAPMLSALDAFARESGIRASLSSEQWMACGVGACMGCALPRADGKGYLRVCADGPVFEAGMIDWEAQQ